MSLDWIVAFCGFAAAVFGFIWLVSRNGSEADKRLHERCDGMQKDFGSYKEQVALMFMTRGDGEKMEGRIYTRLDRIEEKLDRAIEGKGGS